MPDIFGHQVSAPALTAIVGGGGLAVWFAVKQHKAAASASSSANPSAIDPVTGLPYSQDSTIDPLTGESYLAEAQEYGSVQAAEQAVAGESSLDLSSEYGAGSGDTGITGTGVSTDVPATGYASNTAWAQAVTAGLSAIGYTASDVSAALGQYLGSLPETPAQAGIVNVALVEYGPPPTGSFTIIMAPATGATGSGNTGTGTSSGTTATTGTSTSGSKPATGGPVTVVPQDFRVASVSGLTINLAWSNPALPSGQGPVRAVVVAYGQSASSLPYQQTLAAGATSTSIEFNAGAGSNGLTHYFEAWYDPASTGGPHAGPISAKTQ